MTAPAPAEAIPHGLTPEQQLLLTNGMDPSMMAMAQVGTYDPSQLGGENYTVGTQGYYETGTPLAAPNESTEATQQAAETSLVWAETKALENARKDGSNVFAATEAAQHDKDVARARHAIEEALGAPITKDVEETAVKSASDGRAIQKFTSCGRRWYKFSPEKIRYEYLVFKHRVDGFQWCSIAQRRVIHKR